MDQQFGKSKIGKRTSASAAKTRGTYPQGSDGGRPPCAPSFLALTRQHEQVVAAGGDLERALGALLALDVLEVDQRAIGLADLRLRAGEHLRSADVIGELEQRGGGDNLHLRARPGGLRAAGGGADEALARMAACSTPRPRQPSRASQRRRAEGRIPAQSHQ
jgi:hypothetical protein